MMDDVSLNQFQTYCAGTFPDRKNPRVTDLIKLNSGWECDVYSFTLEAVTIRGPQRENLILRMYPGDDGSEKAVREFTGMNWLYQAGYPVPQVLRFEADVSVLGKPFIIMEKIEGRELGNVFGETSQETARKLHIQACKFFVDLHQLDWRAHVPDFELHDLRHPYFYIDRELIYRWSHIIRFSKKGFLPLLGWLESRRNLVPCSRASVIHGDFHPHNILMRDDGSLVVIDWTQNQISDFRFDLGWTLCLFNEFGDTAVRLTFLDEYEQQIGCKVEQIEYFEVAACLKKLFGMTVIILEEPEKIGMRPEAREAITQHMDGMQRMYDFQLERTNIRIPEVENLLASAR
jgi:aminoglycoside phosphotransferase (APT) family kinase protein